eukprot:scaffold216584_cov28-Tisochrysis_lutea.AAC.2
MDAAYLKAHVGGALAAGLAHTVQMQPDDPVAFLAQFLLAADAKKLAATTAAAEREAAEKNAADKAEAARVIAIQKEKAAAAAKAKEDGIVAALDEALEKVRCQRWHAACWPSHIPSQRSARGRDHSSPAPPL